MMSIRSLADFNGSSPGRCSDWLGTATVTARGLNLRDDTTNEGWGLLPGHHRGPPPGHTRGLSHGHGHHPRITGGSELYRLGSFVSSTAKTPAGCGSRLPGTCGDPRVCGWRSACRLAPTW